MRSYRAGEMTPDRMPEKPRALHRGGHVSRFVTDRDLAQSARCYERHAYLRAPAPLRKKRLQALRRLDLPTSARTAPGLQQLVDLASSLLKRDDGDEVHAFIRSVVLRPVCSASSGDRAIVWRIGSTTYTADDNDSIVDDAKQTIVAVSEGAAVPAGHEDPVATSLCSHAILTKSTFVVPDLKQDWRFANNSYCTSIQHCPS